MCDLTETILDIPRFRNDIYKVLPEYLEEVVYANRIPGWLILSDARERELLMQQTKLSSRFCSHRFYMDVDNLENFKKYFDNYLQTLFDRMASYTKKFWVFSEKLQIQMGFEAFQFWWMFWCDTVLIPKVPDPTPSPKNYERWERRRRRIQRSKVRAKR